VRVTRVGEALQISVHNRGRPIPKELLDTLFQPFRRAESASRRSSSGLGLGLYIVHEVVEAHGGTIAVSSDEEQGTTFCVSLPCRGP
jgi:signal transduction histidine kinase